MNNQNLFYVLQSKTEYYLFVLSLHYMIRFDYLIYIFLSLESYILLYICNYTKREKTNSKRNVKLIGSSNWSRKSSNNGNTSRKFFAFPEILSSITKVNDDLFAKILNAFQSEIDIAKFELCTKELGQLYITLYKWYYMWVHKLLIHQPEAIKNVIVPIE